MNVEETIVLEDQETIMSAPEPHQLNDPQVIKSIMNKPGEKSIHYCM